MLSIWISLAQWSSIGADLIIPRDITERPLERVDKLPKPNSRNWIFHPVICLLNKESKKPRASYMRHTRTAKTKILNSKCPGSAPPTAPPRVDMNRCQRSFSNRRRPSLSERWRVTMTKTRRPGAERRWSCRFFHGLYEPNLSV